MNDALESAMLGRWSELGADNATVGMETESQPEGIRLATNETRTSMWKLFHTRVGNVRAEETSLLRAETGRQIAGRRLRSHRLGRRLGRRFGYRLGRWRNHGGLDRHFDRFRNAQSIPGFLRRRRPAILVDDASQKRGC